MRIFTQVEYPYFSIYVLINSKWHDIRAIVIETWLLNGL